MARSMVSSGGRLHDLQIAGAGSLGLLADGEVVGVEVGVVA